MKNVIKKLLYVINRKKIWLFKYHIYEKYHKIEYKEKLSKRSRYYTDDVGTYLSFWTNWWAIIPYKIIGGYLKIFSIPHTIYSTYMCLRYPFLYPRHRLYGTHYTNWGVINLHKKIYSKYHVFKWVEENEKEPQADHKFYRKVRGRCVEWWNNWWALPIANMIDFFHDYVLGFFHCIPTYSEYDAIPDGWRKAFGKDLLKDLKYILKKHHFLYKYRITDIKEKWGHLDWSDGGAPQDVHDIIRQYEEKSKRICFVCGKPAKYRTEGYVLPYCEDCVSNDRLVDDFDKFGEHYKAIGLLKSPFENFQDYSKWLAEFVSKPNVLERTKEIITELPTEYGDLSEDYEHIGLKYYQGNDCIISFDDENTFIVWINKDRSE